MSVLHSECTEKKEKMPLDICHALISHDEYDNLIILIEFFVSASTGMKYDSNRPALSCTRPNQAMNTPGRGWNSEGK